MIVPKMLSYWMSWHTQVQRVLGQALHPWSEKLTRRKWSRQCWKSLI